MLYRSVLTTYVSRPNDRSKRCRTPEHRMQIESKSGVRCTAGLTTFGFSFSYVLERCGAISHLDNFSLVGQNTEAMFFVPLARECKSDFCKSVFGIFEYVYPMWSDEPRKIARF